MMQSVVYNAKSHLVASASPNFPIASNKGPKYQHIAPAPSVLQSSSNELKHTPRKYMPRATNVPYSVDQTQSVQRRNARERNRVKQVNNSFAKLRQHIPQAIISDLTKGGGRGPHKKISKVDTLRIAVEYIRRLQDLIEDRSVGVGCDVGLYNNNNDKLGRLSSENLSNISFSSSASSGGSSKNCFEVDSSSSPPSPSTATTSPAKAVIGSSDSYFTSSALLESPTLPPYQQQFTSTLLTPVSLKAYPLEGGNSSPTSSFNSSISFDSGTFEPTPAIPNTNNTHNNNNNSHDTHMNAHLQLKYEPYDSFHLHEEDCQPDDEEILDYISLWQEQ